MPDVWVTVRELGSDVQHRLAEVLDTRGSDPQQRAMRTAFLGDDRLPTLVPRLGGRLRTGVLTRRLVGLPGVEAVVGVDWHPRSWTRPASLPAAFPNIEFREADGRSLPFDARSFNVVAFDSTLSHVPDPELALAEALTSASARGLASCGASTGCPREDRVC